MSMYLVPADDVSGAIKDCLIDAQMYVLNNQDQFSIEFCVNMKAYIFHVLAQGHMTTSRGQTYSCAMCCTNFKPQCWIASLTTKLKRALNLFNKYEEEVGINEDPEGCVFLHKIKIEIMPILNFISKLGSECPLNQRMKKDGKGAASYASQLEVKCKMLKKSYTYYGDNLAPLKKLYEVNGWDNKLLTGN